jgi:hypothetical protein
LDRRRFALQVRAILVTYRIERRVPNSVTMRAFRVRAHRLLDELDAAAALHPDLRSQVERARAEIDADGT